jgi:hypothetical protein
MLSANADANPCLPIFKRFVNNLLPFAGAALRTTLPEGLIDAVSVLEDADDEENKGMPISATTATSAAMRIKEKKLVRLWP